MEKIRTDWIPQNEYTRPLQGTPYYRNHGIIYAVDRKNEKFMISRIDFERFDDQNFQYVFTPAWSVIDALPPSIFQGIPGLDMSLRLEKYYRVNITPVFISERTPGEGREDLWELLEKVGLDYYDRFEWLLRTDMRCGTDNLIVERANTIGRTIYYNSVKTESLPQNIQPVDCVVIESFQSIASTNHRLRSILSRVLSSGAELMIQNDNKTISDEERNILLKLLMVQEKLDTEQWKEKRSEGIKTAKKEGKYQGRKRQEIDQIVLQVVADEFEKRRITEDVAMERLGIKSRSTLYRRLREYRNNYK